MTIKEFIATIYSISIVTLSVVGVLFIDASYNQSSALHGSQWQAGNIISDSNFYDNTQMTTADIQAWLRNNLACDTDGAKTSEHRGGRDYNGDGRISRSEWARAVYGYTGKFVCLTDYFENISTGQNNLSTGVRPAGSIGAAEIIKKAADDFKINPKVLIVKLRKESPGPLTSDEWPLPSYFNAALGYACPDPPAGQPVVCNPAYSGFYKQVYNAARGLRNYVTYADNYRYKAFKNNQILYNPNTACGSSSVYITNNATAGLYNYTPYQPNQAALDSLYGTGDGCSAYGNRNFWVMYHQMFGAPTVYYAGSQPSHMSGYAQATCAITPFESGLVGRMYHPDSRDFMYTTSHLEACLAIKHGYIWDGIVFKDAKNSPNRTPIYRLVNHERHIFTSSVSVRDDFLKNKGYRDEGIGFYALSTPDENTTPVFGLQRDETFFITSAGKEAESYTYNKFYNFGIAFYTEKLPDNNTPVYRISNSRHSRIYTTSQVEKQIAIRHYGYQDEGVASINDTHPSGVNLPIYRLRSPWGTYFYTTSRYERDIAVVSYNYFSEGIAFYAPMYSSKPVYRAHDPRSALRIYTNSLYEYRQAEQRYGYNGEGVGWYSN